MTAQIPEILFYRNKKHAMCDEPLKKYFRLSGKKPETESPYICSALTRKYLGTWKVVDDRLYLTKIQFGRTTRCDNMIGVFFPDCKGKVFAEWFTGKVRLPQGEMLKYIHLGYASIYEKDLFLYFKNGVLTKTEVIENTIG